MGAVSGPFEFRREERVTQGDEPATEIIDARMRGAGVVKKPVHGELKPHPGIWPASADGLSKRVLGADYLRIEPVEVGNDDSAVVESDLWPESKRQYGQSADEEMVQGEFWAASYPFGECDIGLRKLMQQFIGQAETVREPLPGLALQVPAVHDRLTEVDVT